MDPSSLAPPSFTPPPPPSLNGGLYTGQPFRAGAPWANVPVVPDAGIYNFTNLPPSAPRLAKYMVPGGGIRPGNSTPILPQTYLSSRSDGLNAICIPESDADCQSAGGRCAGGAHGQNGFSYLL